MILTGKCKEDFLKRMLGGEYHYFQLMMLIHQYTLIIDFFDSVGIYIDLNTQVNDNEDLVFTSNIFNNEGYTRYTSCETRQEATKSAIEKANEIYNERNR